MAPVLSVSGLRKTLDRKEILRGLDFEVGAGEIFGFLGPNGAGKTTTMKCLLGLTRPDAGKITILGQEGLPVSVRAQIGFMPENTYLYRHLTGREFLRFNGKFFNVASGVLEARITDLLDKVGLASAADRLLAKYSKGMLQRVGLAQALVNAPKVVFLDEPMSGLDPLGRKMVKDLMLALKKEGTTVFFNTHVLPDVEQVCDRFLILCQGRIVEQCAVADLKEPLEALFVRRVSENTAGPVEIR